MIGMVDKQFQQQPGKMTAEVKYDYFEPIYVFTVQVISFAFLQC